MSSFVAMPAARRESVEWAGFDVVPVSDDAWALVTSRLGGKDSSPD